jgi:transcriptional regulator with XRE-family HTH domain
VLKLGNLPNIIKSYRSKKGLTQGELAQMLGKSKNVISNWENGVNQPDIDMVENLCAILDIPVSDIFGEHKTIIKPNLTEREMNVLSLFAKLSDDEQLKLIGRLEAITEE